MTARRAVTVLVLGLLALIGPYLATPRAMAAGPAAPHRAVVLLGVPGLRWDDISPTATPALWRLAGGGAVGSLSVRTVRSATCPADGWLTLGAGARTTLPAEQAGSCPDPPAPASSGSGVIAGWDDIRAANAATAYDAPLGLLADAVAGAGECTTAIGPGAALALADGAGRVQRYAPDTSRISTALLRRCPLTVIAADALPGSDRGPAVRAADQLLRRVTSALPAGSTLAVAGLADSDPVPHLHALLVRGPRYGPGLLTTTSTRQAGLVQLTDLTPTLLSVLGQPVPREAVGAAATVGDSTSSPRQRVADLTARDTAAQAQRGATGWFFVLAGGGAVTTLAVGLLLLRRREPSAARRTRLLRTGRVLFTVIAALPVAAWLSGLLPWWRWPAPGLDWWLLTVLIAALVGTAALRGPWAGRPFGASGMVAALTAAVLGVDVALLGARLALVSPLGLSPLTAGRFYGFGNIGFAVYATTALLAASWVAGALLRRHGSRRTAAAVVAVIGAAAVVVDGWPAFGSDLGGMLALTPAFLLLVLRVAGIRLTAARVLLGGLATLAVVALVAGLDWARPEAQRSHLGRFVQQLLDGQAGDVLMRKLAAAATSLSTGGVAWLVPLVLLSAAAVAVQPLRWRARGLDEAYAQEPALRDGVLASLLAAALGMVVNDAGVQLPGVCLVVGGALVAAAACAPAPPAPHQSAPQVRAPAPGLPASSG